ncbi:hypothetical protein IRJ41_005081 [Triplophysa rosa]|uniref:Uncharacterized protein n=1 Tax=Triplophysa rosa TaxID=992332 RepID=A0A9W8C8B1_TRIRA|nr:hypothetical protein IRJ41_005081 [Triplophysa rosa]
MGTKKGIQVWNNLRVYLRYVVLHFIKQNEVAVAPSLWLEWNNEVLFCYWPNTNAGAMVKKCVIPDKQLWAKHEVRVFSDTDSYKLARHRAQKATLRTYERSYHQDDSEKKNSSPRNPEEHSIILVGLM